MVRVLLRAYRGELIVSAMLLGLFVIWLILSGLWWVLLVPLGLGLVVGAVVLYAGLSFVTSAGDQYTFGMKMWRRWAQPYVVAYSAALRGQEYLVALAYSQARMGTYTDRQWHRYNKFYNRIRKVAGPPAQDPND